MSLNNPQGLIYHKTITKNFSWQKLFSWRWLKVRKFQNSYLFVSWILLISLSLSLFLSHSLSLFLSLPLSLSLSLSLYIYHTVVLLKKLSLNSNDERNGHIRICSLVPTFVKVLIIHTHTHTHTYIYIYIYIYIYMYIYIMHDL